MAGEFLKWIAAWTLPHAAYEAVRRQMHRRAENGSAAQLALASGNAVVRGRHAGQVCYILANGPSVKQQDLSVLKGKNVISVSSGYLHSLYDEFKPRYHCVPQISYVRLKEEDVVKWFEEMHTRLGSAELFLSSTEESLVTRNRLFGGRVVRYLFLNGKLEEHDDRIPDIASRMPGIQSVPVMALMIAMYMGFTTIYLLGVDHDHFVTGHYNYFYEPTVLRGKDFSTDANGRVLTSRYDEFHELAALWRQYRSIRRIAESNGVRILNATYGGALDEFPRVKLEEVV